MRVVDELCDDLQDVVGSVWGAHDRIQIILVIVSFIIIQHDLPQFLP